MPCDDWVLVELKTEEAKEMEKVKFGITGFGPFCGVADNPTQQLVRKLKGFVEAQSALPLHCSIGKCKVLETAGQAALPDLLKTLESPDELDESPKSSHASSHHDSSQRYDGVRIIWVHLGVNSVATEFALEQRAYNEADFCVPDEAGWQPKHEPIIPEDGPIMFFRQTTLDVPSLVQRLRSLGFPVSSSLSAGRFVCNFVYYHSLRHSAKAAACCQDAACSRHRGGEKATDWQREAGEQSQAGGDRVADSIRAAGGVREVESAGHCSRAGGCVAGSSSEANGAENQQTANKGLVVSNQHASSEGGEREVHRSNHRALRGEGGTSQGIGNSGNGKEGDSRSKGCPAVQSLFVHVPDFNVIPEERQLEFVAALLKLLGGL